MTSAVAAAGSTAELTRAMASKEQFVEPNVPRKMCVALGAREKRWWMAGVGGVCEGVACERHDACATWTLHSFHLQQEN